jgi:membrane protease YdiL (CAAX protease family)
MRASFAIIAAAAATEGLLVIVSYIFAGLLEVWPNWNASLTQCALGVALAVPLLIMNELLWRFSLTRPGSVYARFSREVVVPLCKQLTPGLALLVALASGFGEELFFRGVLNQVAIANLGPTAAALITSSLFAYVHFIGNVKRFAGMLPLYSAVGLYLWFVEHYSGSLCAVFVTHAAYNFVTIVRIRNDQGS